jgi:hypothetical protein
MSAVVALRGKLAWQFGGRKDEAPAPPLLKEDIVGEGYLLDSGGPNR